MNQRLPAPGFVQIHWLKGSYEATMRWVAEQEAAREQERAEEARRQEQFENYWRDHWTNYKRRQIARQIPRAVRGERVLVEWESDYLAGIGIQEGDTIIIERTPDIEPGDLVCVRSRWDTDEPLELGVLWFGRGSELLLAFPNSPHPSGYIYQLSHSFIGRAVAVERDGQPVKPSLTLRPGAKRKAA